jgi:hypothetical protein
VKMQKSDQITSLSYLKVEGIYLEEQVFAD